LEPPVYESRLARWSSFVLLFARLLIACIRSRGCWSLVVDLRGRQRRSFSAGRFPLVVVYLSASALITKDEVVLIDYENTGGN